MSQNRSTELMNVTMLLNRYEIARIIGLRALQIDEGAVPMVTVHEGETSISVSCREIMSGNLDAVVVRDGVRCFVKDACLSQDLMDLLVNLSSHNPISYRQV